MLRLDASMHARAAGRPRQRVIGALVVGWVGTRLETMSADRFWLLHAFVVGFSAVILFTLRGPIKRVLEESARQPSRDSSQNKA